MILTHGAGLNCESPLLVSFADAISMAGLTVLRCDLRFRQKRLSGPPHPAGAADDRAGLREALEKLSKISDPPLYLGGHSYGARQSSIMMTEPEPPSVRGLLLLSYPLHPPRKPDQLRTEHFPLLHTPSFFVHGTRDAFGSPDEMRTALQLIPASTPVRLALMEKSGHELSAHQSTRIHLSTQEFFAFLSLLP